MSRCSSKLCFFVNADWYFELHWLERATAAISDGYSVHLICGKTNDDVLVRLKSHGITCHPIFLQRGSLNPLFFFISVYESFKALRLISPDIIVCITLLPCLYGGIFSRIFNKSIVFSITGTGWIFSSSTFLSSFLRSLVSSAFRIVSRNPRSFTIFENSEDRNLFLRNDMCKEIDSKVISGAGVNTDVFLPTDSSVSFARPFTFLFAARLLNSKGLDTLITAATELHSKGFVFSINVCGLDDNNSPDSISESQIAHWRVLPFVSWLGQRSDMR